jgi:starch synthase
MMSISRKATFADEEGVMYPDNDERAIFFAKGVVETVKKLNWVPDIIHVHGWLLCCPYMKHFTKMRRCFQKLRLLLQYTVSLLMGLDVEMINKVKFDGVPDEAIADLEIPSYENIIKATIKHSDAVIIAQKPVSKFNKIYRIFRKTFLPFAPKDAFAELYTNFYTNEVL